MLRLANTGRHYGLIAIFLHWAIALVLLGLVVLGLYMVQLPDVGFDQVKITLILVHKDVGMATLGAVLLRLGWRVGNALPALVDGLPDWQQVTARFVHLLLYALMLVLPLTGWLMSSAGGYPVTLFGRFAMPDLIGINEQLFHFYIELHRWLAYALIVVAGIHAAAALRHHFLMKDDTLNRMLP